MIRQFLDFIINAITSGNRPMRVFFFGGVFLALIALAVLGKIFGVTTKIDEDVGLSNIILMIVSLFFGFGVSYSIVHFADAIKRKRNSGEL